MENFEEKLFHKSEKYASFKKKGSCIIISVSLFFAIDYTMSDFIIDYYQVYFNEMKVLLLCVQSLQLLALILMIATQLVMLIMINNGINTLNLVSNDSNDKGN